MWCLVIILLSSCCYSSNADIGYVTVNGNKVEMTHASIHAQEYDASGVYHFVDGELAKIACQRNITTAAYLSLKYTTEGKLPGEDLRTATHGTIETQFKVNGPNVMYIKLTADSQNAHIDCIVKTYDNRKLRVFRILPKLQNPKPGLGFEVNGLTLTPIPNQDRQSRSIRYKYDYYDGEELRVRSLINERIVTDNIVCNGTNIPSDLTNVIKEWPTKSVSFSTTLEETVKNMTIDCLVKTTKYGGSDVELWNISLTLVPLDSFDYHPYIKGLSISNILVKFNSSTLTNIHYKYDDDKELYLSCYSDTRGVQWHYDRNEILNTTNPNETQDSGSGFHVISGVFKLRDNVINSAISCTSPKKFIAPKRGEQTTTVTLIRKKNGDTDIDDNLNNSATPTADLNSLPLDPGKEYILIGTAIVTILLVAVVAWTVIVIVGRRRKPQTTDQTDINYENLPHHNDGQMPTPPQWNRDTALYSAPVDCAGETIYAKPYTPETVEELYSQPILKGQRPGPSQPRYEDPTYATVGFEPTYSQVLPKSLRNVQVLPQESTYAEILPKNKSPQAGTGTVPKTNKVQVLPKGEKPKVAPRKPNVGVNRKNSYPKVNHESPYAKVNHESPYAEVNREGPYAEVNREGPYAEVSRRNSDDTTDENPYASTTLNKYDNVFDNKRYVNASSSDDYAEPAYCEVVKK